MQRIPVWKDTEYIFSGVTDVRFRIMLDNDIIYEGRTKARPGDNYCSINVNKICMNYLHNTLENQNFNNITTATTTVVHTEAFRYFTLMSYNEQTDSWSDCEIYGFLFNFSYENIDLSGRIGLNDRIQRNHYCSNMIYTSTEYSTGATGDVVTTYLSILTENEKQQLTSGVTYCGRYNLIYRNLKGGWDYFLFEGKCKKEDEYDISKMKKNYNNTTTQLGEVRYYNNIKEKWELNTGYLSDSEGKKFVKNLAASNECYLQDIVEGRVIPVIITDTTAKYKEYLVENEEPVYYTINVESSQDKINL